MERSSTSQDGDQRASGMMIAVLALVVCLVIACLLYLYFVVHKKIKYWDRRDILHSTTIPFLGNLSGISIRSATSYGRLDEEPESLMEVKSETG